MSDHILENNQEARTEFERRRNNRDLSNMAGYRRAVKDCTGSLPTWAEPRKTGRKVSEPSVIGGLSAAELVDFSRKLSIVIAATTRS